MPKTRDDIEGIVGRTHFPGLEFLVRVLDEPLGHYYLQVQCSEGTCNVTGEPLKWRGRKWLISQHMTDGEIVQTAFLAVRTAQEHEAREQFTYRGVTIFDPHYAPDALAVLRLTPGTVQEREHG